MMICWGLFPPAVSRDPIGLTIMISQPSQGIVTDSAYPITPIITAMNTLVLTHSWASPNSAAKPVKIRNQTKGLKGARFCCGQNNCHHYTGTYQFSSTYRYLVLIGSRLDDG